MLVKILKTDKRLGIKINEIYEASAYGVDPDKITLKGRIPDGYDPECTQYRHEVSQLKSTDTIRCWSCNEPMTLNERSQNDGDCIHCQCEIQLENIQ